MVGRHAYVQFSIHTGSQVKRRCRNQNKEFETCELNIGGHRNTLLIAAVAQNERAPNNPPSTPEFISQTPPNGSFAHLTAPNVIEMTLSRTLQTTSMHTLPKPTRQELSSPNPLQLQP